MTPTAASPLSTTAFEQARAEATRALVAPSMSIVICNYNYARFLGEAITSALAQTPPCQVIVVDDGSTDESRRLLGEADPRVEVLLQPNGGQLAAYQSGLARCRGDVVLFLDADDALEPGAAGAVLECFADGVAKVHFRLALIDEQSRPIGGVVPSTLASGDMLGPLVRHGLLYPSAPGSGNAYRSTVLRELFPLPVDDTDRVAADFFTIYGSIAFGTVAACEATLGRYRVHRRPAAAERSLVFGNAAQGNDEAAKVHSRYARLGPWLLQRTGGVVRTPPTFLDFSVLKSAFAIGVLSKNYLQALRSGSALLTPVVKSLWLQRSFGTTKRLALTAWAVLVLIAPRRVAIRLAQRVCNPASRTS